MPENVAEGNVNKYQAENIRNFSILNIIKGITNIRAFSDLSKEYFLYRIINSFVLKLFFFKLKTITAWHFGSKCIFTTFKVQKRQMNKQRC